MKRKLEILAGIVLLCTVVGFVYYEISRPACVQTPEIKILYYNMTPDNDDISDTIRDEELQHVND